MPEVREHRTRQATVGVCRQRAVERLGAHGRSDALWRLASYELQPPLVRDIGAAVFQTGSVPTALMVWWAAGFTLLTLAWAVRSFARRAL